jgi:hypothetical protein
MEIVAFYETINNYPFCYFVIGLVIGYFLRGFVLHGFSKFRNKKPSRYQGKNSDVSLKRSAPTTELQEPSFDLPNAIVKSITSRQFSSLPIDQHGNEI